MGSILYRDGPQLPQQPPLPPSPQAQPQPPPPPLQSAFVPIQPLPDYNPADYAGSTSPELQRVLVGQQMLGQQPGQGPQLAGLGPGMIPQQAPDGLMVATPAQTLTDTLDDIMAGRRVSTTFSRCFLSPQSVQFLLINKFHRSSEQPRSYVEHYDLTYPAVPATHTDACKHGLPTFSPASLSCR